MIMMMIMSRSTTDPTLRIGASTICNRAAAKENFQPIFSDGIHCEEKSGKAGERTARKWNSHVKARAVFGIQSRPVHEFGVERRRMRTTTTISFECGAYQRRASTWALGQVDGTGRRSIHHLRGNTNEPSLLLFRHKSQRTVRVLLLSLSSSSNCVRESLLVYSPSYCRILMPPPTTTLRSVIHFLHWIFRQHLVTVILTAVIGFFILTIAFALLIWFSAHNHPECVNGVEYEANFFTDAFVLSWTTFSTVVSFVVCKCCERESKYFSWRTNNMQFAFPRATV